MNTLSPFGVAIRVAAASAIVTGFTAGAAVLDTPAISIPVLPAGLSGVLLVVLGFILGRATRSQTARPANQTGTAPQVTATVARQLPKPQPQVVTPTRVILPAAKDGEGAA